jgi:hypothetical protein
VLASNIGTGFVRTTWTSPARVVIAPAATSYSPLSRQCSVYRPNGGGGDECGYDYDNPLMVDILYLLGRGSGRHWEDPVTTVSKYRSSVHVKPRVSPLPRCSHCAPRKPMQAGVLLRKSSTYPTSLLVARASGVGPTNAHNCCTLYVCVETAEC